ncbi:hypothetical protein B9Q01_04690 [Candidatus Marsarchaeota G1 archaeon OSP_D]|jgi:riboflavin synthase alpha subunit|uniref:Lumazine-binding domain-containing protein n=3 Tax=Candidatus Marsarchaeota group 1 TaxID=2203770 RepID=A0A2R6AI14_9ARCH|nr:MAG: hypothetical protein B9Q01_04690 [Candidatus Marsarchaeota G1 archaeon OSP_D]PSN86017.1 MAG: hypothetical protein B9Q02_04120 [Candidatus Marsarchaeota G1 archaeon BE_D]PSN88239.1 MAG: hypothetical protein B9Q00_06350 [Candidatus Marsarchaeota G1 archaeon OSP_C]
MYHDDSAEMRIKVPKWHASMIVKKGSVAVDGVSLTVVKTKTVSWFGLLLTINNTLDLSVQEIV